MRLALWEVLCRAGLAKPADFGKSGKDLPRRHEADFADAVLDALGFDRSKISEWERAKKIARQELEEEGAGS